MKKLLIVLMLVVGVVANAQKGKHKKGRSSDKMVARLTEKLALTEVQQSSIKDFMEANKPERSTVKRNKMTDEEKEAHKNTRQMHRESVNNHIISVLDEEQKEKYEALKQQRKNKKHH